MQHHNCQNCGAELQGAYCHQCGQKGDTHRLTMRHFIEHDLVHGIWHLDKGIFKTLKEIITRPGYLAKEYIAGKRTGHFSLVTLLVLLASLVLFATGHTDSENVNFRIRGERAPAVVKFVNSYAKWLILVVIPIMALSAIQILKRLKYNYAEWLVASGYFIAGALCFIILFRVVNHIPGFLNGYTLLLEVLAIAVYLGFSFRQLTQDYYASDKGIALYLLLLLSFIGYVLFIFWVVMMIYYFTALT